MPATPSTPSSPMAKALTALLDRVPNSRTALRHLAAVENDLRRKDGLGRFFYTTPAETLFVVLRQLDGLSRDTDPDAPIETLRACLLDAISVHDRNSRQERRGRSHEVLSTFLDSASLQVSDGRTSEFEVLQAAWATPRPAKGATAPRPEHADPTAPMPEPSVEPPPA